MNPRLKFRLAALLAAILFAVIGIACVTVKSQQQTTELRARLAQIDSEGFRIADQFRDFLRQLNSWLYRYGEDHHPDDLTHFANSSHALDLWIDAEKSVLTTDEEKADMQKIDTAYDDYLRTAGELTARLQSPAHQHAEIADYSALMLQSQRLFDLGESLAKAHLGSRARLLALANQTISELRILVLASLALLLLFTIALGFVVYRDMILPLRLKLVESQVRVERQEKLAALGMLAAGVAHEVRNPLTAIKAALFILQKQFESGSRGFADAMIVNREVARLERIVSDFLLFGRPGEAQLAKHTAESLLRQVYTLMGPQLETNKVHVILEPVPELWVMADAAQIEQVLINLVKNAAEAIGAEGIIRLRARPSRMRVTLKDMNVVILEVHDNGKGISAEVQQRLFDPFFTTKDTGTGLGLSIAAGIVQKHGGALEYQTQVDYGTTFGIILPRVNP